MSGRSQHAATGSRKLVFIALAIGLGFWLFETVLHEYMFNRQSFADMLLPGNVHELWMRSLATCVIIGFGIYAQLIANRLNQSRKRYQSLFENAPDGILLADIESGRIVDANPAACRLLFRRKADVVGLNQSQLHPPAMTDASKRIFAEHLEQIRRGKNVQPTEHVLLRSDGTHVPVEIAAQIVRIGGRSILQGVFRDITERYKAQEELRTSEQRLAEAQRVAHVGNWSWDLKTNQLYWSEENYQMFWLSHNVTPSYEAFEKTIHPDDLEFVNTSVRNTLERREPYDIDFRIVLPDGGERIIHVTGKVDYDEQDKPSRFFGTVQDVTERRRAEDAVQRQARLLDSIRHAQSLFISGDDPKPVFESLLETLVTITDSEYGFLDEVRRDEDGVLFKKSLALSDISWDEDSRRLYEQLEASDAEFRNLGNLAGDPAMTGKLVISNEPAGVPRSGGVPKGHPPVQCFMGIPVFFGGELVGVAGVANRPGGYDEQMAAFLETFIATCGSIIHAVRNERKEQQITSALGESEERYRRIVEDQTEFLVRWLPDGTRTFVNESYCRYLGISQDQAIGTSFLPLITEDYREAVKSRFASVTPEAPVSTGEHQVVRPDGTICWTQWNDRAIFDDKGTLIEFQSVGRDVTERRLAEEALRESERRNFALFDDAAVPVWEEDFSQVKAYFDQLISSGVSDFREYFRRHPDDVVRCAGMVRVLSANKASTAMLKAPSKKELLLHLPDYFNSEKAWAVFRAELAALAEGATHFQSEIPIRCPDGEELTLDLRLSVLSGYETSLEHVYVSFIDISERKKAAQALIESENKYRAVIENAGEGIVVAQDGMLQFVNPRLSAIAGYSQDEMMSRPFIDFVHPDDRDHMMDIHNRRLAGEDIPRAYELRIRDKHGNTRWLENNGILIEWAGRPASLNFLRDVTDRKKAEEAIRESEERFRGIFENSLVGLYRTTPDGRILMANPALVNMLRYPSIEKLLVELNLETDGYESQCDRQAFKRLIEEQGQVVGLESAWKRSDGTTLFVRESARAVRDENGNVLYYEGTVEDITGRKKAEKQLLEDRAQLKSLASELSLTEERERHRLATELHDHIGQSLVLSKIRLDLLRKSAASGELKGAIEEVGDYLAQVIADTRTLTFDLSSPILYELGIEAAIEEWLNDEIKKKHGIATEFHDDGQDKPLDDDIRTILFRNVRELLINVVKHGSAKTVKVSIAKVGEQVNVSVEDDGIGFDTVEVKAGAAKKAKFGLFSIRERLEQLGGQITIESSPGNGCRITMTAPLKKTAIIAEPYSI